MTSGAPLRPTVIVQSAVEWAVVMLQDRFIHLPVQGIALHVREVEGQEPYFLLAHGLGSNCLTWEAVARRIHQIGHGVVTVDLRGHGLSQKPDGGYGCPNVAADVAELIQTLELKAPILAGQSWGGNVALALGAAYPGLVSGLGFIDGGFIDLKSAIGEDWSEVEQQLKPPSLQGLPVDEMRARLQAHHTDWTAEGIEHTLGNFAVDTAGRITPRLNLAHHLQVLKGLWEMRPQEYFAAVQAPVLICVAEQAGDPDRAARKRAQIKQAESGLAHSATAWFRQTDHDIHVHRPTRLAERLLRELRTGIWAGV